MVRFSFVPGEPRRYAAEMNTLQQYRSAPIAAAVFAILVGCDFNDGSANATNAQLKAMKDAIAAHHNVLETTHKTPTDAESLTARADGISGIDLAGCPADFADAFTKYAEAFHIAAKDGEQIRDFMKVYSVENIEYVNHNAIKTMVELKQGQQNIIEAQERNSKAIRATTRRLQQLCTKYSIEHELPAER